MCQASIRVLCGQHQDSKIEALRPASTFCCGNKPEALFRDSVYNCRSDSTTVAVDGKELASSGCSVRIRMAFTTKRISMDRGRQNGADSYSVAFTRSDGIEPTTRSLVHL